MSATTPVTTPTTPSARSPRRVNAGHPALKNILTNSNPPAPDSFMWSIWLECQDLAQAALATKYMQGIAQGNLDPNAYGQYTVQDAVYSYHGERDYAVAERRARELKEHEVAEFCRIHHESYKTYYTSTFAAWSIVKPDALAPHEAMKAYIAHEEYVTHSLEPIYTVVAMLPCDLLWSWLAEQLAPHNVSSNIYAFWIQQSTGFSGSYHLANFIDSWQAQHPERLVREQAFDIFRTSMTCEVNAFRAACGEELLPLPKEPPAAPMPLSPGGGGTPGA